MEVKTERLVMSKEIEKREQDINPKSFRRGTYWLSMALNTFMSVGIAVVVSYFLWTNIHDAAREAVTQDIKSASEVAQSKTSK